MSEENDDKNEFDFLPPAEPPPAFVQEKDSYHEEVDAEDFSAEGLEDTRAPFQPPGPLDIASEGS